MSMDIDALKREMEEVITSYGYDGREKDTDYEVTDYGLQCILDEWMDNKAELISLFERHPQYNGNGQIVLSDTSYHREVDRNGVYAFYSKYFGTEWTGCCWVGKYFPTEVCEWFPNWYTGKTVNASILNNLNDHTPELKAREGQKMSKVVRKLCKIYGVDKVDGFERDYARFSDAINPLTVTRYTVLSVNPIDYLLMSNGNSWSSCHTIDKTGRVCVGESYHGMYSTGTMSYMLDGTSFVVYTVSSDYNGNEWELQPKIQRNMFHYQEGKLCQGRLYPQCTDGDSGEYTAIRAIVQRVMADCLDIPNLWYVRKGTDVCADFTYHKGTHYRDVLSFEDCNISFVGTKETHKEVGSIMIGHNPICPKCGEEHTDRENIMCKECVDQMICAKCGCVIDPDWNYVVDVDTDLFYCDEDCAERHDVYYCSNDGEYHSECHYDEYEEEYFAGDFIEVNGRYFRSTETAMEYGCVIATDGQLYYPDDGEVCWCEECWEWVLNDDWDDERQMCTECAEKQKQEEEDAEAVEEIREAC